MHRKKDLCFSRISLWLFTALFLQMPMVLLGAELSFAYQLVDLVVTEEPDGTRCAIVGDGDISRYKDLILPTPPLRLVVDIWDVTDGLGRQEYHVSSPELARIRVATHSDRIRLVFYIPEGLGVIPAYRLEKSQKGLVLYLKKVVGQGKKEDQLVMLLLKEGDAVSQYQNSDPDPPTQQESGESAEYASQDLEDNEANQSFSKDLPEEVVKVSVSSQNAKAAEEAGQQESSILNVSDQSVAAGNLNLEEAIQIALENSFSILSAHEAIDEAESRRKSALTDFFPKLSVEGRYTRLNKTPTLASAATAPVPVYPPKASDPSEPNTNQPPVGYTRRIPASSIPAGKPDIWEVQGRVRQPIFTGGALLNRYRLARLGVESAETGLERERQDLALDVVNAYFNVLNAIEQKKVADQAVKLLESQREVSQEFFNVGMIPKNDLLRTEVQLAEAVREQIIAENSIELRKAEFNTILQRPVQTPVELENILAYTAVAFDLEEGIKLAQRNRVELRELDLQIAASERQVRLSQSAYFPQVELSYNLFKTEGRTFAALEEGWSLEAGATWTFWEWGKTYHEVNAARSKVMRDRYNRLQFLDLIAQQVKSAYLVLKTSEQNIFVAQKAVEQGEENFRTEQERYKEQVSTITDVLDSQRLLTRTQADYYNALRNYNVAKAALNRAIGLTVYEPAPTPVNPQEQ